MITLRVELAFFLSELFEIVVKSIDTEDFVHSTQNVLVSKLKKSELRLRIKLFTQLIIYKTL